MSLESKLCNVVVGTVAGIGLAYCAFAYGDDKQRMDLPVDKPVRGSALAPKNESSKPSANKPEKENPKPVQDNSTPVPEKPVPVPEIPPSEKVVPKEDPPTFYGEKIESEGDRISYVVDCSGSMRAALKDPYISFDPSNPSAELVVKKGTRLSRAKNELKRSIYALPKNIEFRIVSYGIWQIAGPGKSVPVIDTAITYGFGDPGGMWSANLPSDKSAAYYFIDRMDSKAVGSGTGTGSAVALALHDRQTKLVVLLTDGAPNAPWRPITGISRIEWHKRRIRAANKGTGAKIDTFGIDSHGDFEQFLKDIADEYKGKYTQVK